MQQDIHVRLEEGARELGLLLSLEEKEKLLAYIQLIQRWNKTYNLTAFKRDEEILVHHVLDSLSVVKPLREHFSKKETLRGLDVGSGGGLPGVVLAIMNPTWEITCVDAVEKKTSFIMQTAGILKLKNLKSKHTRIEVYQVPPVDLVISRAFASLADFANLAGHHVAPEGSLVAMKGHYLEQEVEELFQQSQWELAAYHPIHVPQLGAERCLMYLKPKGNDLG